MPPILAQNGRVNNQPSPDAVAQLTLAAVAASWRLRNRSVIGGDGSTWSRTRWTAPSGNAFEFLNHSYVTDAGSGHCFPGGNGSLLGCPGPVQRARGQQAAYSIGEDAMRWFMANERSHLTR